MARYRSSSASSIMERRPPEPGPSCFVAVRCWTPSNARCHGGCSGHRRHALRQDRYGSKVAVAVFLILCGFWLMDVPPLSRIGLSSKVVPTRRGAFGALGLGLVYGLILGPCSFAFLAPMIGIAFSAGSSDLGFGIGLMAAFALGHCSAIVTAGTFGDAVRAMLARRGSGSRCHLVQASLRGNRRRGRGDPSDRLKIGNNTIQFECATCGQGPIYFEPKEQHTC